MSLGMFEIVVHVVAGLGAVLMVYGVFLEREKRQDAVFTIGAACLFVYALYIQNRIFMVTTGAFFAASFFEFIELIIGHHKHTTKDVGVYKKEG